MGSEIILLFLPFVLLHMFYVVHVSSRPGRRLRAYLLAAVALAAAFATIVGAGGSVQQFLVFGCFFYVITVVPAALVSDWMRRAKKSLARVQPPEKAKETGE